MRRPERTSPVSVRVTEDVLPKRLKTAFDDAVGTPAVHFVGECHEPLPLIQFVSAPLTDVAKIPATAIDKKDPFMAPSIHRGREYRQL